MITIIDYGIGNLGSIMNIIRKAGGRVRISGDPEQIQQSDKLILPGVGAFDRGMRNLLERGLVGVLNEQVIGQRKPILGICLGVQLFTRGSAEGREAGLGWIQADTVRFDFSGGSVLPVPHMGWNNIEADVGDPLFGELPTQPRFYFVHSYHLKCDRDEDVTAWANYGYRFACGIRRDNIWGTQFHPEKSHKYGLQVMKNFIAL
jgi:glutamine amidotransferase